MSIDMKTVQKFLEEKKSFRLGARGICIDFKFAPAAKSWCVSIPRAFLNLNFLQVAFWGSTTLALINNDSSIAYIDLVDFDKLTAVIE